MSTYKKTNFTGACHTCSNYNSRPWTCKEYPFEKRLNKNSNVFIPRFKECQFYTEENLFVTSDELLKTISQEEINQYCLECGLCCWLPTEEVYLELTQQKPEDVDWSCMVMDKEYWLERCSPCSMLVVSDPLKTIPHLFNYYRTDKNTVHSYTDVYHELFKPLKDKQISLLELGVLKGYSLQVWREYFLHGDIHGVDIKLLPHTKNLDLSIHLYEEDAYSHSFLSFLNNKKFDIIIDNGPHTKESMITVAKNYPYYLSSTGILIIEDIQHIGWCVDIINAFPSNLQDKVYIKDLRSSKNRYDDILIILDLRNE